MRTLPGMRSREEKEMSSTLERFLSTPRTTAKQQIETRSESTIVIALWLEIIWTTEYSPLSVTVDQDDTVNNGKAFLENP